MDFFHLLIKLDEKQPYQGAIAMTETSRFTGRDAELENITNSWRKASNTEDPNPQIVLLKGERGVGKTRLAFEFYRWLSENNDPRIGSSGYWPDAMGIYRNAINVNPHPRDCNFNVQIPYLWWGLHVSGLKNPIDTISSFDAYLAPHLAMLLAVSIKRRKGIDLAAALADLGIDVGITFIEDLTYLGLIKRLAEGAKKGVDIIRGGMGETSIEKALQVPQSRATSVLQQLERVFSSTRDYATTPGVILIDDAQDIDPTKDPAILAFIEQLFHNAVTQKWPILILVTHWKRELSLEVTPQEYSFAGLLRHCIHGRESENGPAAGLPGGFLNNANFKEIELGPIEDLSNVLRDQLPGITRDQSSGLLHATGGNPRFLEQVIQFALENEGFFEDFDTSNSLSSDGYNELLSETKSQDIFRVVRRRLIEAPDEVKEAICLASLQGTRFANDLVNAIARVQLSKDIHLPLEKAEDPYSWVAGTKNKANDRIGTFVEYLFYQVAENVRPHIKSLGGEAKLLLSFKDTIRGLIEDEEFRRSDAHETQLIAYSVAADLFENSSDPKELSLAQRAMSYIAMVHLRRSSLEAATAAYERLLKTAPPDRNWILGGEWQDRVKILDFLVLAYRKLDWPSKMSSACKRMIWMGYHNIDDENQKIFVFSRDPEEVNKVFNEWKQKKLKKIIQGSYFDGMDPKPDSSYISERLEKDYFDSTRVIVQGLLGLAELALAWPNMKFDEGDDPVPDAPFMIKALETDKNGKLTGERTDLEGPEIFSTLKERAYTLGTLLGENIAQYEHFKLLADDIARSNSDKGNITGAIGALERALVIAEKMDNTILQIQVLNNIGLVYGENGEHKKSEEVLLKAGKLHNEKFTGESFSVVALSNEGGVEYHRIKNDFNKDDPRILGYINIPDQLSALFSQNPNEAVAQARKIMRLVGNIEGNLGMNLLQAGELDKAEKRFQYAMESYSDLNDGPNIAQTYANFGEIAKRRGQTKVACDWWSRSISVYEKLKDVDNKDGRDILWQNAIRGLEGAIRKSGCEKTN